MLPDPVRSSASPVRLGSFRLMIMIMIVIKNNAKRNNEHVRRLSKVAQDFNFLTCTHVVTRPMEILS